MKKSIMALFMVFVMLFSFMPGVAFAEDNDTEPTVVAISAGVNESGEEKDDVPKAVNESGKDDKPEPREGPIAKKIRERLQEKKEEIREKFAEAAEKYLEARQQHLEKRQDFLAAKQEVVKCRGDDSTECEEAREKVKSDAKEYLVKIADVVLESLDKVAAKVSESEDLTEEEKAELLADIDERIADVEEAKATVQESDDNAEITKAAITIKTEWAKTRVTLKHAVGRVVNARIGGIIVQSEKLGEKLERILERLEDKGHDVSEAEGLVEDFDAKIAEAKGHYDAAQESYKDAKDNIGNGAVDMVADGHKSMVDAHKALKEARVILKDIVKAIKASGNGDSAIEDEAEDSEPEDNESVE